MPKLPDLRVRFTMQGIENLPAPSHGRRVYHDTIADGLVLIVYASGSKAFHLYKRIPGQISAVKPKIGKFPHMSVEIARKTAMQMLSAISKGEIPQSLSQRLRKQPEAQDITVAELFQYYLDQYAKHHTSSWRDAEKNFRRYFADWLDMPVNRISRADVQQEINRLGSERGQPTANRAYDIIRAIYSWGIKYCYIKGENPCTGVKLFRLRSRERFIRPDEFTAFFSALKGERNIDFRDYVYLSLFTGARQGNVLSMRWDEVDLELGLWHIPVTKNKESQTVPLTQLAIEVLQDRLEKRKSDVWVFPSDGRTGHLVEPKTAWRKFLLKTGITNLRMHDLRRTLGSYMAMNNQSLQMIGKVLGHKSPTATQIYSRLAFDPIRQAMEAAQASMVTSAEVLPRLDNRKKGRLKRVK